MKDFYGGNHVIVWCWLLSPAVKDESKGYTHYHLLEFPSCGTRNKIKLMYQVVTMDTHAHTTHIHRHPPHTHIHTNTSPLHTYINTPSTHTHKYPEISEIRHTHNDPINTHKSSWNSRPRGRNTERRRK